MKNILVRISVTMWIMAIAICFFGVPSHAMVKDVYSTNYLTYEKTYADMHGYNKGECNPSYKVGEEYFYNEYYDHWNVDLVYDKNLVTSRKLAKEYCKVNYPNHKIKFVKLNSKKLLKRKGKKVVYIEKIISKSKGRYGWTTKGHYYIAYNRKVKKGKKVVSYCVWNPYTNYCDDVVAVADNKQIR